MKKIIRAAAVVASLCSISAYAAFADLDCTFGTGGTTSIPDSFGSLMSAVGRSDGSAVVRIGFQSTGGQIRNIDSSGMPGATLATVGQGSDLDMALQADGNIIFANGAGSFNANPPAGIGRVLAAGGMDMTFGVNGFATVAGLTYAASAPIVLPDGRLLTGGKVNGAAALVRFNADGTPDTSFGVGAVSSNAAAGTTYFSIAIQSDGYIVALSENVIARHRPDGQLDTTFGSSGMISHGGIFHAMGSGQPGVRLIRIQPSGKILVLGYADANNTTLRIARYVTTGLDATVASGTGYRDVATPAGLVSVSQIGAPPMSLLPDGRPIFGGNNPGGAGGQGVLVRYSVDLADDAFVVVPAPATGAYALPTGRVLVGNASTSSFSSNVLAYFGNDGPGTITTATLLSSAPNPSPAGRATTFTATITPATGTATAQGCVQFKSGTADIGALMPVVAGSASISLSNLPEGANSISVTFAGRDPFTRSASTTYTQTVSPKIVTSTTIASSPNPSAFSQSVTLTTSVTPASGSDVPTGSVLFMADGYPIAPAVSLSSGNAVLNTTFLRAGVRSLTAVYSGDASFAASSSAAATHTVNTAPTMGVFGDRDCSFGTGGAALVVSGFASTLNTVPDATGTLVVRAGQADTSYNIDRVGPQGDFIKILRPFLRSGNLTDAQEVVLPDGKILALDASASSSSQPFGGPGALLRLLPDGSTDATFGNAGSVQLTGYPTFALRAGPAVQPDGRILVSGFNSVGATMNRFNADGSVDASFGTAGIVNNASAGAFASLAVQPDGRIVALGANVLVRYLPDGQLDTSFGTGGSVSLSGIVTPKVVRLQPSGHILVAGSAPNTTPARQRLARFTASGALDTSAAGGTGYRDATAPSGPLVYASSSFYPLAIRPLTVMPDGRPLIIGGFAPNSIGSVVSGAMIRYAADLSDDASVQFDFAPTFVTVLPDGKYLVGRYLIAELRRFLDESFPPTCSPTTTSLVSNPNPSDFVQAVTLTATVSSSSGIPTGTVQFKAGASSVGSPATLTNGVASVVTSSLPSGTLSLTAVYAGSGNFSASASTPVTQVVRPGLTVDDQAVNVAAATSMTFTVTLSSPVNSTVTVDYATADHTALAGVDYNAQAGTLTFAPGETTKTVVVALAPRIAPQADKDFFLLLSNPTNTALAKSNGIGKITYASTGALTLFVDDPFVLEGYSGITLMGFTVTLSAPQSGKIVTVNYATANGTGTAGVDFTGVSGTIQFGYGETKHFVMVPVLANATPQPDRTLLLNLSGASGATIIKAQGTGTIKDDDPAPPAATIAQYRLYSPITKEHLYTTDTNEYAVLGTRGWVQEGVAYTMFKEGGSHGTQYPVPLYRMYHGGIQQHHWTTDTNEVMVLVGGGAWSYEGIAGYVLPNADAGTTPLYRLSYAKPPLHLWTTDLNEKDTLVAQYGWRYEGVVGEVLP